MKITSKFVNYRKNQKENAMSYKDIFISNLKFYKGNKSENQIAKESGIKQQMINRYLKGESEPSLTKIMKLCEYFNCTPNDLLLN